MSRKLIDTLGISLVVTCLGAVALGQGTTISILGTTFLNLPLDPQDT